MFSEEHNTPEASSSPNEQQVTESDSAPAPPLQITPAAATSSPSSNFVDRVELFAARLPEYYIAPFCGASAGVASGIVTCPLDVIKTKLQAQGGFRRNGHVAETSKIYRGMLGTGKIIWREDGIRGLYQGLGPMLLGYLPTWAVYLAIYDRSRDYFYETTG
jgi:solute carrier family 25 folate transporter 32